MGSLNIKSLCKHIDDKLKALMVRQPQDILAINETKLDSADCDALLDLSGYVLMHRDQVSLVERSVFIYVIL